MNLTVETLLETAQGHAGQELLTRVQGKPFKVAVENGRPIFFAGPNMLPRKATNRRRLDLIVQRYNQTGSLSVSDYKDTQSRNLSYIMKLVELATRGD